ncbi:MAG: ribbon-helix-helix protein, CopG family [Gammaproteobacteria bacterium]
MKTLINIPDNQLVIIQQICEEQHVSRTELIRQALTLLIERHNKKSTNVDKAFGILRNKKLDSLAYQRKLREEW